MKYLRKKDLNSQFVIKMGSTNLIGYEYIDIDDNCKYNKTMAMSKEKEKLKEKDSAIV